MKGITTNSIPPRTLSHNICSRYLHGKRRHLFQRNQVDAQYPLLTSELRHPDDPTAVP